MLTPFLARAKNPPRRPRFALTRAPRAVRHSSAQRVRPSAVGLSIDGARPSHGQSAYILPTRSSLRREARAPAI
ncbi:hypothetical protein HYPSUDRAFT_791111 [Hypholoma sublateritium FD-334 SS-4]|uniref:Uncharacterized protein n=1 Tax=Hypholoma sublateritium (strain FD-334 SS-4) TaxID=945553 RepID=A0A0D2PHK1_HYPSF|nr:hypothetical protein HYPSUDRAFT_791111 [Hypholoma sublateritium FD-334 SS-4]